MIRAASLLLTLTRTRTMTRAVSRSLSRTVLWTMTRAVSLSPSLMRFCFSWTRRLCLSVRLSVFLSLGLSARLSDSREAAVEEVVAADISECQARCLQCIRHFARARLVQSGGDKVFKQTFTQTIAVIVTVIVAVAGAVTVAVGGEASVEAATEAAHQADRFRVAAAATAQSFVPVAAHGVEEFLGEFASVGFAQEAAAQERVERDLQLPPDLKRIADAFHAAAVIVNQVAH